MPLYTKYKLGSKQWPTTPISGNKEWHSHPLAVICMAWRVLGAVRNDVVPVEIWEKLSRLLDLYRSTNYGGWKITGSMESYNTLLDWTCGPLFCEHFLYYYKQAYLPLQLHTRAERVMVQPDDFCTIQSLIVVVACDSDGRYMSQYPDTSTWVYADYCAQMFSIRMWPN